MRLGFGSPQIGGAAPWAPNAAEMQHADAGASTGEVAHTPAQATSGPVRSIYTPAQATSGPAPGLSTDGGPPRRADSASTPTAVAGTLGDLPMASAAAPGLSTEGDTSSDSEAEGLQPVPGAAQFGEEEGGARASAGANAAPELARKVSQVKTCSVVLRAWSCSVGPSACCVCVGVCMHWRLVAGRSACQCRAWNRCLMCRSDCDAGPRHEAGAGNRPGLHDLDQTCKALSDWV
jgi:hypothetical protein